MSDKEKRLLLTRREFELAGAGAVLAAGCHTYQPACPHDRNQEDVLGGYEPVALKRVHCLTIAAACEVMIAPCPPLISAVEVARRADRLVQRMPPKLVQQIHLALDGIEALAGASVFRPGGFSELDLEDRRRALEKAVATRGIPRDMTRVLKLLTVGPYYSHPEVRRAIGYVDFEERPRYVALPQFTARLKHAEPAEFG